MKKTRKILAISTLALALPFLVLAYNPATLVKGASRVAVKTAETAQYYFGLGYTLEGVETAVKPNLPVCECPIIGASQNNSFWQSFDDNIAVGGKVFATSTSNAAETLRAKDIINNRVIDYTMNGAAVTLTLPASSTLAGFLPKSGDSQTLMIRNATTTVQNITIAGGTGVILKKQSGGALTITGDADASNYAIITFVRKANKDIVATMLTFVD
jgi:hypothetical protein